MQLDNYNNIYSSVFETENIKNQIKDSVALVKQAQEIYFVGNGGSAAICSHMMEDYTKILNKRTFSFTDAALITCFCNDYGYENGMAEWLSRYINGGGLLFAISSSGNSKNILNAAETASKKGAKVITLSGFEIKNPLADKGAINFHVPIKNYGVVECFHQIITHAILDEAANE